MDFTPHENKCLAIVCKAILRNIETKDKSEFCVIATSKKMMKKIRKAGGMTKTDIVRSTRTISIEERDDCLDFLTENGLLKQESRITEGSKKPTTYFTPV